MAIEDHDNRSNRCRMLGHEVEFRYCRQGSRVDGEDSPCRKILDCWFETFDVEEFIRENYGQAMIDEILQPPKPKMASILELIEQARKNMPPGQ